MSLATKRERGMIGKIFQGEDGEIDTEKLDNAKKRELESEGLYPASPSTEEPQEGEPRGSVSLQNDRPDERLTNLQKTRRTNANCRITYASSAKQVLQRLYRNIVNPITAA